MTDRYEEEVVITGDSSGAEAALNRTSAAVATASSTWSSKITAAGRSLDAVGRRMVSIGRSATTFLTLPLVGVGIAAFKMAGDFDLAMKKITALVGVGRKQVDAWRQDILELSNDTGVAATDLANAMFLITSSGLRGKVAMDVLQTAAKGSAAGLGDVQTLADAATSALASYGKANLTAAQATDFLAGTIKAGKTEASALAPVIGQILPVAAKAEVGLDQVGAAIAALSRGSGNVAGAVTNLKLLIRSLLLPTPAAVVEMKKLGFTATHLRTVLAEQGLPAAINLVSKAIKGNELALTRLIPGQEAQSAFLSLTGPLSKAYAETQKQVAGSVGLTAEAYKETEGPSRDYARAQQEAKNALIDFGTAALPVLSSLLHKVTDLIHWFSGLSTGTKEWIARIGLIVAAVGPVLGILGSLARILGVLTMGAGQSGAAIGRIVTGGRLLVSWGQNAYRTMGLLADGTISVRQAINSAIGPTVAWTAAIGTLIIAANQLHTLLNMDDQQAQVWAQDIMSGKHSLDEYQKAVDQVTGDKTLSDKWNGDQTVLDALGKTVKAVHDYFFDLAGSQGASAQAAELFTSVMAHAKGITAAQAKVLAGVVAVNSRYGHVLTDTQIQLLSNLVAQGDYNGALRASVRIVKQNAGSSEELAAALKRVGVPLRQMGLDHQTLAKKLDDERNKQDDATKAVKDSGKAYNSASGAIARLIAYEERLAQITLLNTQRQIALAHAMANTHGGGGGGGSGGGGGGQAMGAIIRAAHGMIVRSPTLLTGEGSYATPFGRGAESIVPLDARGQEILGKAVAMGLKRVGVGGGGPTIVIQGPIYGFDDFIRHVDNAMATIVYRESN